MNSTQTIKNYRLHGFLTLIYSLLIFSGGLIGFVLKKSTMSLTAGTLFGLLLIFASALLLSHRKRGLYIAFFSSAFLTLLFSFRFFLTLRFLPSGLLWLVSSLMVVWLTRELFASKQSAR